MIRLQKSGRWLWLVLLAVAWQAGCSPGPVAVSTPQRVTTVILPVTTTASTAGSTIAPESAPVATRLSDAAAPPAQSTPVSAANTPAPSVTSIPDAGTPSLTLTPSPTPLHPLSIPAQRQRAYPGSEITIEQTLAPGANYNRYIASYLSDGLKIYALLTVPRGAKPPTGFPVIVFNHGYISPSVYRTTERYVDYVDMIARSGYIVFKSDYRGHGSSEGAARGGYGSPDYTVDVLNAVASVKKFPDADPARIGMWGHSMGGYITLRALVIDPELKAGVIWGGVVASYPDLLSRWRRNNPPTGGGSFTFRRGWRTELVEEYGTPEENPEFWDSISANSYLAELSAPIQLHHGTADASVPVEFSQMLEQQIQDVDGAVELYLYQGDNHNISRNFRTAMTRSIQFFDKYVKGS